jgi:hypothetical protein
MDDFLIYLVYVLLFLNLIFYSISFFRKEKANVFFVWYIVSSCIMQFSMEVLYRLAIHNLIVVNTFFIIQFILLGLFFKSLFTNKKQIMYVQYSMYLGLFLIACQYVYDYNLLFDFNLFAISLTSLLLVCYALMHLYNQLATEKVYYFITIGIIIYMLPSTVLYLIGNLTENLSEDFKYISWQLNACLVIVQQVLYLYECKVSFLKKEATLKI